MAKQKIAKITINKDIGNHDVYAEMFGEAQPCFSSTDMQKFIDDNVDADIIEVVIDSNGGNTTQGFAIHDMLVGAKAKGATIRTIGYKVNSIATVIFLAGDERQLSKNAEFIVHNPALDPYALGWDTRLTAEELQAIADEVKVVENKMIDFYTTSLSLDDTKKQQLTDMLAAETNLTSDQALEFGFATSIINGPTVVKATKAYAYSDKIAAIFSNKTNTDMDKKQFQEALKGLTDKVSALFKGLNLNEDGTPAKQIKAAVEKTDGGASLYFDGESIGNGVTVYSDEGMTTVASPGDYKLESGATFKVDDAGVVSDFAASSSGEETDAEKLTAANAKISDLEAQLSAQKQEVVAAKATAAQVAKELVAMKQTIETMSKFVPGENREIKGSTGVTRPDDDPVKKRLEQQRKAREIGKGGSNG